MALEAGDFTPRPPITEVSLSTPTQELLARLAEKRARLPEGTPKPKLVAPRISYHPKSYKEWIGAVAGGAVAFGITLGLFHLAYETSLQNLQRANSQRKEGDRLSVTVRATVEAIKAQAAVKTADELNRMLIASDAVEAELNGFTRAAAPTARPTATPEVRSIMGTQQNLSAVMDGLEIEPPLVTTTQDGQPEVVFIVPEGTPIPVFGPTPTIQSLRVDAGGNFGGELNPSGRP